MNKCKLGLWDNSVPCLKLNDSGVSNFAKNACYDLRLNHVIQLLSKQ